MTKEQLEQVCSMQRSAILMLEARQIMLKEFFKLRCVQPFYSMGAQNCFDLTRKERAIEIIKQEPWF